MLQYVRHANHAIHGRTYLVAHRCQENRFRLVGLLGIKPGLLQVLQNTHSFADVDARRYQFDYLALGITNWHEHEIQCHKTAVGIARPYVMAHDLAAERPLNVPTDLSLYLRRIGEPCGLIKPLSYDVLAF